MEKKNNSRIPESEQQGSNSRVSILSGFHEMVYEVIDSKVWEVDWSSVKILHPKK